MKRISAVLAGVVLALVAVPLFAGTAKASCAGPQADASPKTAVVSGQLTITGQGFAADCNDTIINGQTAPPVAPTTGIKIVFVQNGRSSTLATVNADAQYRFTKVVTVPAWAKSGQASVSAGETTVSLTITAAGSTGPTDAGPSELPVTGPRKALPNVLVAFLFLTLGTGLIWSARRPSAVGRHRR